MEALILYFVLFFPAMPIWSSADSLAETVRIIPFSITRELARTVTHTLPAIALLLYLIYSKIPSKEGFSPRRAAVPGRRDIPAFAIGLPILIIIGLFVAFLTGLAAGISPPVRIAGPYSFLGWAVVILACLGTGYLEEIYFRYYLLTKTENLIPNTTSRVMLSVLLFAACHIHDGFWGVLNAAIAGLFLAVLFLRYRSLHGIALAHAGYNVFVYAMGVG